MLALFLQPEHHCRVILIDLPGHGHLLRDEFLEDGGHACLRTPLRPGELISEVRDAAACWEKIDQAYRKSIQVH
jgi:hypothetical protein